MAQQKGFACPACGAEFDTREQVDDHSRRKHQQTAQPPSGTPEDVGSPARRQE